MERIRNWLGAPQTANLRLFLAGMALLGVAGGISETTFNNFVNDSFHIGADARGFLEFPRELPGFLTALFAGLLFFLPETYIAAGSALAVGFGMLGMAFWGTHWSGMLGCLVLWSIGVHLAMPVRSSISMDLAPASRKGWRLGQIYGVGIAASIIGCLVVWLAMKYLGAGYPTVFATGGMAAIAGGLFLFAMRMPNAHLQRPRFVWNRRYTLYYILSFLFGARKQLFITFGPWVLIKIFHQEAYIFAQLWIVASVLGIFLQPALGQAIDRFGERLVLIADALLTFLVCTGYGCAHLLPGRITALGLLYGCFVLDQMLFGMNMARDTYLAKIAVRPDHVAPTLSLGISINHAVSMSIPAIGGLVWIRYGHSAVFFGAAVVALLMLVFSSLVRVPRAG